jgi:hypothetical protein
MNEARKSAPQKPSNDLIKLPTKLPVEKENARTRPSAIKGQAPMVSGADRTAAARSCHHSIASFAGEGGQTPPLTSRTFGPHLNS